MTKNRRMVAILLALSACLAYGGIRACHIIRPSKPSWMSLHQDRGRRIKDNGPTSGWNRLGLLIAQSRSTEAGHLPLAYVSLVELAGTEGEATRWRADPVINLGFAPMDRLETTLPSGEDLFVGFYAESGTPLRYTVRRIEGLKRNMPATVELPGPLPPGHTQMVVRVYRQRITLKADRKGVLRFGPGRWVPMTPSFCIAGVMLPEEAEIVRCIPDGAAIADAKEPAVSWILTSRDPTNLVHQVEFRLPSRPKQGEPK